MGEALPDILEMEKGDRKRWAAERKTAEVMLNYWNRLVRLQTSPDWAEYEKAMRLRMEAIIQRMTATDADTNTMLRCAGAVSELKSLLSGAKLARIKVSELTAKIEVYKEQEAPRVAGSHPEV